MAELPPLDTNALAPLAPAIRNELRRLALSGAMSVAASLNHVITHLLGADRSRQDQIRFLVYTAPDRDRSHRLRWSHRRHRHPRLGPGRMAALARLFDPLCAHMIDLHYFAGLTTQGNNARAQHADAGRHPRSTFREGVAASEGDLKVGCMTLQPDYAECCKQQISLCRQLGGVLNNSLSELDRRGVNEARRPYWTTLQASVRQGSMVVRDG